MDKKALRQDDSSDTSASDGRDKVGATADKDTNIELPEERIAPDIFDARYQTTKTEIYAYYRCVDH